MLCTTWPKLVMPWRPISSATTASWRASPPTPPYSAGMSVQSRPTSPALFQMLAVDVVLLAPARVVRHDLALDEAPRGVAEHLELVVHPGRSVFAHGLLPGKDQNNAPALAFGSAPKTDFTSRNSSNPNAPHSRPRPDCL